MTRVGVISDTHGLLRPEAVAALEGSDLIVHAGDVGEAAVLDALAELAPVRAVRGNVDGGRWAHALPPTDAVEVEGVTLWVLHILEDLDIDPATAGIAAVIHGHTHRPAVERRGGVLYLNPGSAGRRRFDLPVSVARIEVTGAELRAELLELEIPR